MALHPFCNLLLTSILATAVHCGFFTCDDLVEKLSDCGDLQETEGFFEHMGIQIAYTTYEDKSNTDPSQHPLILVHGGPGVSSSHVIPFKQMACRGRKVIGYDQGGVDRSFVANVTENAPFLLEIPYYVKELYVLIAHFGLNEYNLLGVSWGTMVAQEFAMTEPEGMKTLTLVGALSNGQFYIEEQRKTRHSTLPPFMQKLLKKFEETGDFESPLHEAVNTYLTGLWTLRTMPMPDCIEHTFQTMNRDIYVAINGPSEFTVSGMLWDWDVTGKVNGDLYPTVVFGGEHDTMTYECVKQVADGIQNSVLHIIPNAGHLSYVDQPDYFMDILHEFLVNNEHKNDKKTEL